MEHKFLGLLGVLSWTGLLMEVVVSSNLFGVLMHLTQLIKLVIILLLDFSSNNQIYKVPNQVDPKVTIKFI